jgi:hypothetical protein
MSTETVQTLAGDPAFRAAYLDGGHPGHADAVARMSAAHERALQSAPEASGRAPDGSASPEAAPPPGASPASPGGRYGVDAYNNLSLTLDANMSDQNVVAIHQQARGLARAFDLEPELARGGSEILDRAIAGRAGTAMDASELNRLDALLERHAAGDVEGVLARFTAALHRAGEAHAAQLRRVLLHAGPEAAVFAIMSIGGRR